MADIPNNQLSQVGRFRGYACSARQTHTTIVHPATSMLCAVRLPITKNKAHIVETGLIPRNDRTAASGPRPRYCYYSTQSLSCGATKVLQKCYECATAFQLSTIIVYPVLTTPWGWGCRQGQASCPPSG